MSNGEKITNLEYKYNENVYYITIKEIKNFQNGKIKIFIEIYCGTKNGEDYYYKFDAEKDINYINPYEDINFAFTKKQVIFNKNSNDELYIYLPILFYNIKQYSTNEPKKIIKTIYYNIAAEKDKDRIILSIFLNKKVYKFEFNKVDLEKIDIDINEDIDKNGKKFKKLIEDNELKFIEKNDSVILSKIKGHSFVMKSFDDITLLNMFDDLFEENPKYYVNNGITKIINESNNNNNNSLKRIDKIIKEINDKQQEIKSICPQIEQNIRKMKENAGLMIFPKSRFPHSKEGGVEIDSYIIYKNKDFSLINEKLLEVYGTSKVKYELLYRASRDRDLAKIFKQKCKGVRGTLIIVQTEGTKRIFGGFTTQVWDDSERNYDDDKAFCFSVDENKIYELRQYCSAIGCDKDSGPRFCWIFEINNKFMLEGGKLYREEVSHYEGQERDYELNDGDEFFNVHELEAFKVIEDDF